MGTYHNNYSKNEDFMLWELHEVRHRLQEEHKKMSVDEINERAKKVRKEAEYRHRENINI